MTTQNDASTAVTAALQQLLALLAADAPAEQLAQPAAQARAAGVGPHDQDVIAEATRTALGLPPPCSTPRATWPPCATWTPYCVPSCTGRAPCWAPTSPTSP